MQKPRKDLKQICTAGLKIKPHVFDTLLQYEAEGMTPFNAGIRAGLGAKLAAVYEIEYNSQEVFFKRVPTQRDVCERRGVSLGACIDKLRECAGIGLDSRGVPWRGAMRTVSAVNTDRDAGAGSVEFVEVDDWQTRVKAIKELCVVAGYIKTKENADDKEQGNTIVIVRAERNARGQERHIEIQRGETQG